MREREGREGREGGRKEGGREGREGGREGGGREGGREGFIQCLKKRMFGRLADNSVRWLVSGF